MFQAIKDDLKSLSRERFWTKYLLFLIIFILSIALVGQLLAQLFTVNQFQKVTGRIVAKSIRVTGYDSGSRYARGKSGYSLVLSLDNKQSYNIDLEDVDSQGYALDTLLHKGDKVTLYNPSKLYRILNLDLLDFGSRVRQVEIGHTILYDFKKHQHTAWEFIGFLLLAVIPFCYFLYDRYKNAKN